MHLFAMLSADGVLTHGRRAYTEATYAPEAAVVGAGL
jgi:hypothetical protein